MTATEDRMREAFDDDYNRPLVLIAAAVADEMVDEAMADLRKQHAEMLAALKLIAEFAGKTLIAPSLGDDGDRGHQLGALKAFNQCADIAKDAIAAAEASGTGG